MNNPAPVVLVTAGASGIGLAIASRFLAGGYRVHVCDLDASALAQMKDTLPAATASQADVSDPGQVESMFADLERIHGRLDVLVNNAGIAGPVAPLEEISIEDWNRTIAVDLDGLFYVTRMAIPLLRAAGGGAIINMASTAGLFGCPLRAPYVASKWAIIGLTKTLAMELGRDGIRVNAICPGSVSGPRIDGVIARAAEQQGKTTDEIRQSWTRQVSMNTFVDAADVAAMAWFLASEEARYISGQSMAVDGHTESLSSPSD